MRSVRAIAHVTLSIAAVLTMACTPKTPTSNPSPSPGIQFGGPPAATALASLRFQPKSGTWEVAGKAAADKVKPFNVVIEFQPDGLIRINGTQQTPEAAVLEPWNRDY